MTHRHICDATKNGNSSRCGTLTDDMIHNVLHVTGVCVCVCVSAHAGLHAHLHSSIFAPVAQRPLLLSCLLFLLPPSHTHIPADTSPRSTQAEGSQHLCGAPSPLLTHSSRAEEQGGFFAFIISCAVRPRFHTARGTEERRR